MSYTVLKRKFGTREITLGDVATALNIPLDLAKSHVKALEADNRITVVARIGAEAIPIYQLSDNAGGKKEPPQRKPFDWRNASEADLGAAMAKAVRSEGHRKSMPKFTREAARSVAKTKGAALNDLVKSATELLRTNGEMRVTDLQTQMSFTRRQAQETIAAMHAKGIIYRGQSNLPWVPSEGWAAGEGR